MNNSLYRHNVVFRVFTVILLCALVLPSISSIKIIQASAPEESVARRAATLQGNPNFDPNKLPSNVRLWYNRLWYAIKGSTYPDPDVAANSGDLYQIGRTLNDYVTALLTAFRYTGDLKLLDEVDRVLEIARAKLGDSNKDGYLNWRWLNDPNVTLYYGKDTHKMDEMLAHATIAAGAYALHVNRGYKAVYADHANFWRNYLQNHFLEKWSKRGGLDFELVHPYAHFMRFYYYMYKLTGNGAYLTEANRRATVLDRMMVTRTTAGGTGYTWDHRISKPYGCQPTVYSFLTISAFQDMWREGFNKYATDAYMKFYATTFRDLVLKSGITSLAGTVCGSSTESFGKFLISNVPGLIVWDNTGKILNITRQAYVNNETLEKPKRVFIPAYMIQALSAGSVLPGEPTPEVPPTDGPTDTPVTPVFPTPTTPGNTQVPPGNRVTNGLQALYTFEEGSGATVRDVSGVGTALDLTVSVPAGIKWIPGGLTIQGETMLASAGNATKIVDAAKQSNQITIEAWIQPANNTQTGPVNILALVQDSTHRDAMIAQSAAYYTSRLRTTTTDLNGKPYINTASGTAKASLTHLVYTRDAQGNARYYVNGVQNQAGTVGGNFSNWENYRLVLANELTNSRLWRGNYYLVAVYSRALTAAEVKQNMDSGPNGTSSNPSPTQVPPTKTATPLPTAVPTGVPTEQPTTGSRVTNNLQALYTFDEGSGATVRDVSGVGTALDLTVSNPAGVKWIPGGLTVQSDTIIASAGNATKIVDAAKASNEITIETWIQPANTTQSGPVNILALVQDSTHRDAMIAQSGTFYTSRLRTTATDLNGKPYISTASGTVTTGLTHLVYTRDAQGNARYYINGVQSKAGTVSGNFSNWENYRLVLTNELNGSRLWRGNFYLVAVYSRALSADEIKQNLNAGADGQAASVAIAVPGLVTEAPTEEILPTEEVLPTEVVPTDEVLPTEEIPTEIVPTEEILPTEVVPTEIVPTDVVPVGEPGLLGEYFNDLEFTNLALTRADAVVDFDWGYGIPDPAVRDDDFTIRWTGQVVPLNTETYTFYTVSDDGVRLWINDQLVIDNWTQHGAVEDSVTIDLIAGQPYPIRLEFYEGKAHAVIQLLWSSASQAKQVIPASQLFHATPVQPDPTAVPTEIVPTEVVPTEIVPTDVVPTEIVPTEVVPTIAPPVETLPPPPFVLPQVIEAESEAVVKVGSWTTHETDLASGLSYIFSSGALDDTLNFTFEGTRVDVVYVTHPALGSFGIAVDGMLMQSVNSQSTEAAFGAQVAIANLPAGQHLVSIYPLAGTIAIDAFVVEQQTVPPVETTEPPVEPTETLPTDVPVQTEVPPTMLPTSTPLPIGLPYGDTFDTGLGWTVEGTWRLDPQTAVSGSSWFVDSSQRGLTSILTFDGSVMLGAALNPEISFSQKASLSNVDWIIVEISIDGGVSWLPVDQQVGMVTDWAQHTVNLAAFQGQTIRLRVRIDATAALPQGAVSIGYWIDNLMIQDVLPTPTPTMIPTELPTLMPTNMPTLVPTQEPPVIPTGIPAETLTPVGPTPEAPPADASPTPSP